MCDGETISPQLKAVCVAMASGLVSNLFSSYRNLIVWPSTACQPFLPNILLLYTVSFFVFLILFSSLVNPRYLICLSHSLVIFVVCLIFASAVPMRYFDSFACLFSHSLCLLQASTFVCLLAHTALIICCNPDLSLLTGPARPTFLSFPTIQSVLPAAGPLLRAVSGISLVKALLPSLDDVCAHSACGTWKSSSAEADVPRC